MRVGSWAPKVEQPLPGLDGRATRIVEIIRYGGSLPGHGPRGMPVWGKVFSEEGGGGKGVAIANSGLGLHATYGSM